MLRARSARLAEALAEEVGREARRAGYPVAVGGGPGRLVVEGREVPEDALRLIVAVATLRACLRRGLARRAVPTGAMPAEGAWTFPLLTTLLALLRRSATLDVDAFAALRLPGRFAGIGDRSAEGLVRRQYREFVALLRRLVEPEAPVLERLDVVVRGEEAVFRDGDGRPLPAERLAALRALVFCEQARHDEAILSTLVLLLPLQVVLHLPAGGAPGLLLTVGAVFGRRLAVCAGCEGCRPPGRSPSQAPPPTV